jgi:hypothetical protein
LRWTSWDLTEHQNKKAVVRIVDNASGPWGHLLADQIMLSDHPLDELLADGRPRDGDERVIVLADFEGDTYVPWQPDPREEACCATGTCGPDGVCEPIPETYVERVVSHGASNVERVSLQNSGRRWQEPEQHFE